MRYQIIYMSLWDHNLLILPIVGTIYLEHIKQDILTNIMHLLQTTSKISWFVCSK